MAWGIELMTHVSWLRKTWLRTAAAYAALFLFAVLAIFGATFAYVSREMRAAMDASIAQDIGELLVEYQDKGVPALQEAVNERVAETQADDRVYLFTNLAGKTVAGNIASQPATGGRYEGALATLVDPAHGTEPSSRFYGEARPIKDGVLFVGRSAHQLDETLEILLGAFVLGAAGTTLSAVGLGSFLGRLSARRIETISRTTRDIVAKDLKRRVPIRAAGDEFDALSADINSMLDRIQDLMEGIRQISSDIAHDLRMPLTRLKHRLEAELGRGTVSPRAHNRHLKSMIAEADGIIETFNSLLRIAQMEGGARKSGFRTTSLSDVLLDLREIYEPVAEDSGHSLTTDVELGVSVAGDRELLVQLFANLVENALRHVPSGGRVYLQLCKHMTHIDAAVSDNGPGIPTDEHGKVFRRLYRMERSRTTAGSGLGLSLVAAIADLHGAKVQLGDNRPGLKVSVRFALADAHHLEHAS